MSYDLKAFEREFKLNEMIVYLRGMFRLDWTGIHGSPHWSRVYRNGILIAQREGARIDVVTLFAFLHDHQRENDYTDPLHGHRAAENAHKLRGTYFNIDDAGMALLVDAMTLHSDGHTEADITVQTCWDADRLDLGRVGMKPNPRYLCTATAKDLIFLEECYERSIR